MCGLARVGARRTRAGYVVAEVHEQRNCAEPEQWALAGDGDGRYAPTTRRARSEGTGQRKRESADVQCGDLPVGPRRGGWSLTRVPACVPERRWSADRPPWLAVCCVAGYSQHRPRRGRAPAFIAHEPACRPSPASSLFVSGAAVASAGFATRLPLCRSAAAQKLVARSIAPEVSSSKFSRSSDVVRSRCSPDGASKVRSARRAPYYEAAGMSRAIHRIAARAAEVDTADGRSGSGESGEAAGGVCPAREWPKHPRWRRRFASGGSGRGNVDGRLDSDLKSRLEKVLSPMRR